MARGDSPAAWLAAAVRILEKKIEHLEKELTEVKARELAYLCWDPRGAAEFVWNPDAPTFVPNAEKSTEQKNDIEKDTESENAERINDTEKTTGQKKSAELKKATERNTEGKNEIEKNTEQKMENAELKKTTEKDTDQRNDAEKNTGQKKSVELRKTEQPVQPFGPGGGRCLGSFAAASGCCGPGPFVFSAGTKESRCMDQNVPMYVARRRAERNVAAEASQRPGRKEEQMQPAEKVQAYKANCLYVGNLLSAASADGAAGAAAAVGAADYEEACLYVGKKVLESVRKKLYKGKEISQDLVEELAFSDCVADEEVMVPVDMRRFVKFDSVEMLLDKLGPVGAARALVDAADQFEANKMKIPKDKRPRPMTAREWRAVFENG
mmetsp:Transcript_113398/g.352192  ORF Transcript_113398/g.352192 Transcript_113398/m.352192 type:complete len:381 (-) Transcript_113398:56-1198(-)